MGRRLTFFRTSITPDSIRGEASSAIDEGDKNTRIRKGDTLVRGRATRRRCTLGLYGTTRSGGPRCAAAGVGLVRQRGERRSICPPRAADGASRARRDGGAVQRPGAQLLARRRLRIPAGEQLLLPDRAPATELSARPDAGQYVEAGNSVRH